MSFSYRYMLVATIVPTAPVDLLRWLDACISGESPEPRFDVPEAAAEMVSEAAWLLELGGHRFPSSQGLGGSSSELAVFVSNVHEGEVAALYGLPLLIAPYCDDGTIAVMWTDMTPDVDPKFVFAQKGVAFVGSRNGLPVAAVHDDADPPPWALDLELPTIHDLTGLGLDDGQTFFRMARDCGEPVLARHLLARSVLRQLRDADFAALSAGREISETERAQLKAAARMGAQMTLDLIEAGGDPLVVKNTPGWQLQEVRARDRYGSQPVSGTGRPLTRLAEALGEVDPASLDDGPKRLIEGEVLTVLAPLGLVARGPMIYTTDGAGRVSGAPQHLTIEVPAGSRLEITTVYDRGHAECRPVEGNFIPWIRPPDRAMDGHPAEPVAPLEEYALGWLRPADEGRLFERRQPG